MKSRSVVAPVPARPAPEPQESLRRIVIHDGTLEALKWLALVLMVLDHVNKFLCADKLPGAFELGRLVMPIFGFVLAYNLARPDALAKGVHVRVMKRLLVFGTLSMPMFVVLVGWWPLNILFMLLLVTAVMYLQDKGGTWNLAAAGALFFVGGAFVEFWWPALATCLAARAYIRRPTLMRLALWTVATASLGLINRNLWAIVALPILIGASNLTLEVPRLRWVFYGFYPVHLAVLLAIQKILI